MPGKALLIGSDYGSLRGVAHDVAAMRLLLEDRGFSVHECIRPNATRAGIIAAYEGFIEDVDEGDAAVVFYSGHGFFVPPSYDDADPPETMDMQFIVPIDDRDSPDADFRGIASVELSMLQQRLADKTRNVVVILDCCHSGQMSRASGLRVEGLPQPSSYQWVRRHIDSLKAEGLPLERWRSEGHPHVVRIVACGPRQLAFEHLAENGKCMGVLTESLGKALAEAGREKVSWATTLDRVRQRVIDTAFDQRPEVEGPCDRLLFSTTRESPLASLPVTPIDDAGRVRLECAPLIGVQAGDRFMIMPTGSRQFDDKTKIGNLTISLIEPLCATGQVVFAPSAAQRALLGARAFRTVVTASRIPVRVPDDGPRAAELIAALPATSLVRVAEPGEQDWLVEARIDADSMLTVRDRIGPLHPPRPTAADAIARTAADLKIFAQAISLHRLIGSTSCPFGATVAVEWGEVVDGVPRPAASAGAVMHAGARIYIRVRNDGAAPAFASLVDIGVSGRITVLNSSTPSGRELRRGEAWTFGFDELNEIWKGATLKWPEGLDPARARPEPVLVFVTLAPQDLRALQQPEIGQARGSRRGFGASPLQSMIDQIGTGDSRDLDPDEQDGVRYDVHAVTFDLGPVPDAGRFLLDKRPDPGTMLVKAAGGSAMPLAIRLEELAVHRDGPLFGGPDVRIDTVVATGGCGTGRARYEARTAHLNGLSNRLAQPFDPMPIFSGEADGYVDMAVWVSRDDSEAPDLADLLRGRPADPVGAWVTAAVAGAGAFVVNSSYRLLRGALGDSTGIYRGVRLQAGRSSPTSTGR